MTEELSREAFVEQQLRCLQLEREAEIRDLSRQLCDSASGALCWRQLRERGWCAAPLHAVDSCTALFGRRQLELASVSAAGRSLANCRLSAGDPVHVLCLDRDRPATVGTAAESFRQSGVISCTSDCSVTVAFSADTKLPATRPESRDCYAVVRAADAVTYRRLRHALTALASGNTLLHRVLFAESALPAESVATASATDGGGADPESGSMGWVNGQLDEWQRRAVRRAVARPVLHIVHGPPGTGKTTTLVEAIVQLARRGERVLACAASNTAVDHLLTRLAVAMTAADGAAVTGGGRARPSAGRLVRLGHPARAGASVQQHCLDALVLAADEASVVHELRAEIDTLVARPQRARDSCRAAPPASASSAAQLTPAARRSELKTLRRELRERELRLTRSVLQRAQVVLCTLTGAGDDGPLRQLPEDHFQLVVIDECSQAVEAACWLAIPRAPRLLLAGDHHQLPPTVLSRQAAAGGLGRSLMERCLCSPGGAAVTSTLCTQYRMNGLIQQWCSDHFYQSKLQPHPSVAGHCLAELAGVDDCDVTRHVLLLIDTAGCHMPEVAGESAAAGAAAVHTTVGGESCANDGEADLIVAHASALLTAGVRAADIGVVTPYSRQVALICERLAAASSIASSSSPLSDLGRVEVHTVDGFQGSEKEAIVMSLVRSNERGCVGFLAERRRLNVAVSRARRHLAVVCDTSTVSADPMIASLLEHMCACGEVQSAAAVYTDRIGTPAAARRQQQQSSAVSSSTQRQMLRGSTTVRTPVSARADRRHHQQQQPGATRHKTASSPRPAAAGGASQLSLVRAGGAKTRVDRPRAATHEKGTSGAGTAEPDDDNTLRVAELRRMLEQFVCGDRSDWLCPISFTAFDRLQLHGMCEEISLLHRTTTDTSSGRRQLLVSRPSSTPQSCQSQLESNSVANGAAGADSTSTSEVHGSEKPTDRCFAAARTHVSDVLCLSATDDGIACKLPLSAGVRKHCVYEEASSADDAVRSDVGGVQQLQDSVASCTNVACSSLKKQAVAKTASAEQCDTTYYTCAHCCSRVPVSNRQLHQLRCAAASAVSQQLQQLPASATTAATARPQPAKQSRQRGKQRRLATQRDTTEVDHILSQLEAVSVDDGTSDALATPRCHAAAAAAVYGRCSHNTNRLLLQSCLLCSRLFCLSHHQAEVHGCGEAARRQARQQFLLSHSRSGASQKQRQLQQQHLAARIGQMEKSRHKNDERKHAK